MKIKDTLSNFLYDEEYYIVNYSDSVYIYNCQNIKVCTTTKIILELNNLIVDILGSDLKIVKYVNKECLIEGTIQEIRKTYE